MKSVRLILILLVLAAAAAYFLRPRPPADAQAVYPGYGEGEWVYLSSPIGGELTELTVARGDQAAKDAVIFTLDRQEEQAARAEAEEMLRESMTRLDKAKLDYERAKNLRDKRVISPEDYDAAQQTLLGAQHTVAARQRAFEQADWRYAQKQQTAPLAGLVYDTYQRPGEWVAAGAPVAALLPPEYMKVRFFVPETELGKMPVGAPIEIRADGLAEALPGRVSFVSPKAEYTLPIIYSRENRSKLVFLVEGSLAPEDARKLHPGAPVEVRLKTAP